MELPNLKNKNIVVASTMIKGKVLGAGKIKKEDSILVNIDRALGTGSSLFTICKFISYFVN